LEELARRRPNGETAERRRKLLDDLEEEEEEEEELLEELFLELDRRFNRDGVFLMGVTSSASGRGFTEARR
jgi:hypothetical protein